ncbi:hypothetical protein SNE40_017146 [Patella caerulea]|uniref:Uncharacterized protein n=1 Tax=Patella caerulea TaxID=87958 RepID=A0AAN8P983_PATCE
MYRKKFHEDPLFINNSTLRDNKTFAASVSYVNNNDVIHNMGIKSDCSFHSLEGCHVSNPALTACLGHALALFLKELVINRKWFDVNTINCKIQSLKLKGSDSGNRPAMLKQDMSIIKGHAVQNWTFLRLLPILIGEYVLDIEDDVWQANLLLRHLTE